MHGIRRCSDELIGDAEDPVTLLQLGERDSFSEVRKKYAERLRERVENGDTLSPEELSFLEAVRVDPDDIPERLHVKKPTAIRSPAQKAQAHLNPQHVYTVQPKLLPRPMRRNPNQSVPQP